MQNNKLVIGSIAIALGIAGLAYYLSQNGTLEIPPVFPTATSTAEVPGAASSEEEEGGAASSTPTQPATPKGPTINLTPYTVYLGNAIQFGTSSPTLMQQEGNEVVVGYEWESIFPSPMFDSVVLPNWSASDSARYTVYVWDFDQNAYVLLDTYSSGKDIQFPRNELNGPIKFKVVGIDPALRVCPGDRSFNWSFRFTYQGPISVVRTPITQALPAGETCKMR